MTLQVWASMSETLPDEASSGVEECPRPAALDDGRTLHQQKMQMIGRVVLDVAHDMKNLLGVILGYTSLMRTTLISGTNDLDQIDDVVKRASSVVQRLLDMGGRNNNKLHEIDLSAHVRDLGPLLHCLAGSRIWLRYGLGNSLPTVLASGVDLDQTIINLVANARDASTSGGEICIETSEAFLNEELVHGCGFVP